MCRSFRGLMVLAFLLSAKNSLAVPLVDTLNGRAISTYALIISISEYPNEPSWPKVNSSNDIANLKQFINKFSTENDIQVLQDKNATKKKIIEGLNNISARVSAGNNVVIHFSGGGFQVRDDNFDETDGKDEVIMPYDAPSVLNMNEASATGRRIDVSHLITDDEIGVYLASIRKKLGKDGQFLFMIDASNFGPSENTPQSAIGRGGFIEVPNTSVDGIKTVGYAPFIMITSCLEKQLSIFLEDKNGMYSRSFSAALKAYTESVADAVVVSYTEFFSGFSKQLKMLSPTQTPSMSGDVAGTNVLNDKPAKSLQNPTGISTINGRLFILSIGISNYKGPYSFVNCDDDAIMFTKTITDAFKKLSNGEIRSWLLLNEKATKQAMIDAISEIAIAAKDNDVFAFFFAGFTNQPALTNGAFEETWFYPYTAKTVSIDHRVGFNEHEIITLSALKKLLDYLKCDKQLLFTEAGPSENFKREFVKSMIKTNPVIADIVKRNRVIIVPTSFGLDNTECNGNIEHGPGLYYFDKLKTAGINVFSLFSEKKEEREDVLFKYRQLQTECKYPDFDYMSFFFEKEFVEDLQYYFSRDDSSIISRTRAIGRDPLQKSTAPQVIKNKYALVIGTSKFKNWDPLENPVNDARAVADTLSNLFGFKTKVLENPSLGEIYKALYNYTGIVKEDDQFLLYIAGHGYYDTTIYQDGFIVAHDSRKLEADTFLTSYLPFNQLRIITDNFKAKQVMVLLDVCFSGAFDDNEELIGGNSNYNLSYKLDKRAVNSKLQMVTRKYITAGSRIEEVPDNFKGGHSPFAWFLLEGLRRAAKEKKYMTSGMLFRYIQAYLEDTVPLQSGYGKDQLRLGSEFIFISKQE